MMPKQELILKLEQLLEMKPDPGDVTLEHEHRLGMTPLDECGRLLERGEAFVVSRRILAEIIVYLKARRR